MNDATAGVATVKKAPEKNPYSTPKTAIPATVCTPSKAQTRLPVMKPLGMITDGNGNQRKAHMGPESRKTNL